MSDKNRKFIVYIPYCKGGRTVNSNEYISNMIGILEEEYHVEGELSAPLNISRLLSTKAVFLNWVEGAELNKRMRIKLIFYKLFGAKVIWVFHNKYPHDAAVNKVSTGNMNWLAQHSDTIILHSKSSRAYIPNLLRNGKKAVYVPHIVYNVQKKKTDTEILKENYGIGEDDFVFTIFGRIRPYKNIEKGIEVFQNIGVPDVKLLIAGAPADAKYARQIKSLCRENPNIILDLHYLSDAKLDAVIDLSDVILLTHKSVSSMNSGVMIQAFSRGKTVIAPDICMARDLVQYDFFYMYQESLDQVIMKAYNNGKDMNEHMGKMAQKYVFKNNNREVVKKCIRNILK